MYQAPLEDYDFILRYIIDYTMIFEKNHAFSKNYSDIHTILSQAAKFAQDILEPHYWDNEQRGASFTNNIVTLPPSMKDIYQKFCNAGWNAVSAPAEYGGNALPVTIETIIFEMISSAHFAFGLCPLLSQGVIHTLYLWGNESQKSLYLDKLISGQWSGTMNLTESQAGSDLGLITTKAIPHEEDSYLLYGTKIFITFGDHDLTENIIHLVLARLPNSPIGTKGLSLFLVPKFLVHPDGSLGKKNDITTLGIEDKLGLHSSPTCTLKYGEHFGAIGYLVGEENQGLKVILTMMNDARLQVASQSVGVSEIAFQKALFYAKSRLQGQEIIDDTQKTIPIIHHPDIQNQLLTIAVTNYVSRILIIHTSSCLDKIQHTDTIEDKKFLKDNIEFLIPIIKNWASIHATELTSRALQIFGGLGYSEETKIACHFRDSRITSIYEGTSGIQAIDFIGRKLGKNQMQIFHDYIQKISSLTQKCLSDADPLLNMFGEHLETVNDEWLQAGEWIYQKYYLLNQKPEALAGATSFTHLSGLVLGGYFAVQAAYDIITQKIPSPQSYDKYINYAHFYIEQLLPQSKSLAYISTRGTSSLEAAKKWL